MIQLQAINNVLSNNNLDEYLNSYVESKHFIGYEEEFKYIKKHFDKYEKVPDIATFLVRFPNIDLIDVLEPAEYIINNLKEDYLYEQGVKLFTESARLLENNSFEGLEHILRNAEKLLTNNVTSEFTDINCELFSNKKIKSIEEKKNKDGLIGISSGFKEIDDVMGGWLPGEELVTIVGRVNQGKSWLIQKFLTEAHKQGKRVLLYSGEMSELQVAFRNDTLSNNYSNRQLMRGTISDADFENWKKHMIDDTNKYKEFYVITPKDLGNKYLTVSTLKQLIKRLKPDIVGIDQLSLMDDDRGGDGKRFQLANITMGLYSLSEEFHIPILADSQAKRGTKTETPENPGLDDIAEADAIGQNSSRMISLVQTKAGLSLFIAKNRYGENNKKLVYAWDIDLGTFNYVSNTEEIEAINSGLPLRNDKKEKNPIEVF